MCGIAGFVDFSGKSENNVLNDMVNALGHRGPDDRGTECYMKNNVSIGMSQARLSILDLSPLGHQPMHFESLSVVFNGEIYNFKEIRSELETLGYNFTTQSDTEVILKAYSEWSSEAVHKFIGMFAIVIYDRSADQIILFRDRAGVKPLYYYWDGEIFLFASELKAFHRHSRFKKEVDETGLQLYFRYGYIPAPGTIFKDCHKLNSASSLTIDLKTKAIHIRKYWEVSAFYTMPKLQISYEDAKSTLHDLFRSAFMYRMIADVPVGVFLSGGYDSTAVAAIIQANNSLPLKTFTIGFREGNNEAPFANLTARHLKTDHHELYCTQKEAQNIIAELPYYFDEPFADSSAIPTILVSRFAKQFVTVALSADGGDEIFGGYDVYQTIFRSNQILNAIPDGLKNTSKKILTSAERIGSLPESLRFKLESVSSALNRDIILQTAILHDKMVGTPKKYSTEIFSKPLSEGNTVDSAIDLRSFDNEMDFIMNVDYQRYLQDDILVKVDRASMSCSLEGREPFLDHRIIEFASQLPLDFKFQKGLQKRILKDIVHEYVPKNMMDRPKTGFSLPINKWLIGELAFLLEEYLSKEAISRSGLFNTELVFHKVEQFKKGKLHHVAFIWKVLMFQMWYTKWLK